VLDQSGGKKGSPRSRPWRRPKLQLAANSVRPVGSLPPAAVGPADGGAALDARPESRPQPHRPVQFCAQPQLRDAPNLGQFGRPLRLLALGQLHAQLGLLLGAGRVARGGGRGVGAAPGAAVGREGVGGRPGQSSPQPRVAQRRRRGHPLLGVPLETLGDEVEEEGVVTAFERALQVLGGGRPPVLAPAREAAAQHGAAVGQRRRRAVARVAL